MNGMLNGAGVQSEAPASQEEPHAPRTGHLVWAVVTTVNYNVLVAGGAAPGKRVCLPLSSEYCKI